MSEKQFNIGSGETLIVFSGSEERSKGFFDELDKTSDSHVLIKSGAWDSIDFKGGISIKDCRECDELSLVSSVLEIVRQTDNIVNIDVSILSRIEFLYLLRMLHKIGKYDQTRILYTVPEDYLASESYNPTIGIKNISSVPGFIDKSPLNKPLVLVMILGYEPARSLAIYNNVDPDRTYLIIPDPPYKDSWKGRTERKNSDLISTVSEDRVLHMHSSNVESFADQFESFLLDDLEGLSDWNCRISPLGTKPQALGVFQYWKNNPGAFSILHSKPLKQSKLFSPKGISSRRVLKSPK